MLLTMSAVIGHRTRLLINMIQQEKAIGGISMGKEVELSLFADIIPVNSQINDRMKLNYKRIQ